MTGRTPPGVHGVHGVSVRFGDVRALTDLDLELPAGTITAVVGGDGSGRSTLVRVLAGLVRADAGTVSVPPADRIGVALGDTGVYGDLSVTENLHLVADAFAIHGPERTRRIDDLLARADLTDARRRLGAQLSGGMRRKLAVLLAIVHRPALVLLDEPTTAVDPVSRAELWRLIVRAAADGITVLVTTTYFDEAERVDRLLVLDRGRALLRGAPSEVLEPGQRLEDVVVAAQLAAPAEVMT